MCYIFHYFGQDFFYKHGIEFSIKRKKGLHNCQFVLFIIEKNKENQNQAKLGNS